MAKEVTTIRLESEILEKLKIKSAEVNRPVSNYIETFLMEHLENDYLEYVRGIAELRLLLLRVDLKLPEDKLLLEAYEKLAIYVIQNFDIPGSHTDYIRNSFKVENCDTSDILMAGIIERNKKIKDHFSIEIPLRGVEVFFSYGKPKIEAFQHKKLKYLIAKLHSLIGDKVNL